MEDPICRWSQIVRRPASVQLWGHHQTSVPAEGQGLVVTSSRPGLRLMTQPVSGHPWRPLIDVTSSSVQAMLEGFLRSGVGVGKILSWQSKGAGVRRRDTIHLTHGVR